MRIVGGELRGRKIIAPKGDTSRPTTDRNRESLFNILASQKPELFKGARVIDLFAGSGALGLEAISRGAAFALFVETDAAARGAIRENIDTLGLFGRTRLHRRSATSLGARPASAGEPFDVAFLDPPYRNNFAPLALQELDKGGWLRSGATIIIEQSKDEEPPEVEKYVCSDNRLYGGSQLSFFIYQP
ncbi:MAG: 16S rRNA (guanine(966)-N(2))-methyltransferase RsmD [Pseudomonadota bacterium]